MNKIEKIEDAIKHLILIDILQPKNFQTVIAEKMDANKTTVSQALKGNSSYLTDKFIERFCDAFPQVKNIFEETSDIEVQKIHNPPYTEAVYDDEVPVYDIDAAANLKTLFETKQPNILDTLRIPNLPKCDGAVYVRGDSMYPILKSGDIVAYKQIHGLDYLVFGEMYLIDFNLNGDFYLSVKYITKSEKENYVKLVSYNTHHEPMDIPISSINAIAMIKASVRINTMM